MVDFRAIKEAVTTKEAASFYGIKVGRNGMCRCPFHDDHTPSMKVDKRFICFGCQEKGDVIDFVAKLFGLDVKEAAEKIAVDFGIAADISDMEKYRQLQHAIQQKKSEQQIFYERKRELIKVIGNLMNDIREIKSEYAPETPLLDMCDQLFVMACHDFEYVCYLYDYIVFDVTDDVLKTEIEFLEKEVNKINARYRSERNQKNNKRVS